eukprot:GHVS01035780.1.p1 GENE.GHVS01035780.1~~GHVS01035780.1.p1  ORF type:complete len:639 (+),score=129.07 GHVS01035780.1:137-1918(+)
MAHRSRLVCVLWLISCSLSVSTTASSRLRKLAAPPPSSQRGALAAIMGNEDVQAMLKDILSAVASGAEEKVGDRTGEEQVKLTEVTAPPAVPKEEVVGSREAINKAKALLGITVEEDVDKAEAVDLEKSFEEVESLDLEKSFEEVESLDLEKAVEGVESLDMEKDLKPLHDTDSEESRAPSSVKEEEYVIASNLKPVAVDDVSVLEEVSSVSVTDEYKRVEGVEAIARSTVKDLMESVLRIHVIRTIQDFGKPWTTKGETRATGSGFPIDNRLIITNAHVASDAHIIRVEKPGSPTLWDARVVSIADEPDLCVLAVDADDFWLGLVPLQFVDSPAPTGRGVPGRQDVPELLDGVYVVGYPTGGDSLSVTQGIVSRVEVGYYAHSSAFLLEIQIDAAINPGNSGGPVVNINGEVVGVAFQGLTKADSIGYIIPVPIVKHVLKDIDMKGEYTGMVSLGVMIQSLRNPVLQDYLGVTQIFPESMPEGTEANGVVVTAVDEMRARKFQGGGLPESGEIGFQKNDVILALDGQNVAEDGTILFRNVERVAMNFLLCGKFAGDFIEATVLRKKEVVNVVIPLDVPQYLVPTHTNNMKPR